MAKNGAHLFLPDFLERNQNRNVDFFQTFEFNTFQLLKLMLFHSLLVLFGTRHTWLVKAI